MYKPSEPQAENLGPFFLLSNSCFTIGTSIPPQHTIDEVPHLMLKIEVIPAAQAPAALATSVSRNEDIDRLADALLDAKRLDWLRIPLDQLTGKSGDAKRSNLVKLLASRAS